MCLACVNIQPCFLNPLNITESATNPLLCNSYNVLCICITIQDKVDKLQTKIYIIILKRYTFNSNILCNLNILSEQKLKQAKTNEMPLISVHVKLIQIKATGIIVLSIFYSDSRVKFTNFCF